MSLQLTHRNVCDVYNVNNSILAQLFFNYIETSVYECMYYWQSRISWTGAEKPLQEVDECMVMSKVCERADVGMCSG